MASQVDICNMALATVGSNTTIVSISPPDGSAAAQYCALYYDLARREALASCGGGWSWARKRAALTLFASNPSDQWAYAYALPGDCLVPLRVLATATYPNYGSLGVYDGGTAAALALLGYQTSFEERGSANFQIERGETQQILLTNEPEATLFYLVDQTDTTTWSPAFVAGMVKLVASYIAGPILRGMPGAKLAAALRLEALGRDNRGGLLGVAAALDARASGEETAEHISDTIKVRA